MQTDVKGSSTDGALLRVKRIVLDVNMKIKTHKYVLLIIQKALAFWTSFEIQCVKLFLCSLSYSRLRQNTCIKKESCSKFKIRWKKYKSIAMNRLNIWKREREGEREREITKKNIITYYKVSLVHFCTCLRFGFKWNETYYICFILSCIFFN